MATHSSVLAWRILGTEEPVGSRLWGHTESDTTDVTQQQQQQQMISDSAAILENINCIYFNKVCNFVLELLKKKKTTKKTNKQKKTALRRPGLISS